MITGGAQSLGLELATQLAADYNVTVCLLDINEVSLCFVSLLFTSTQEGVLAAAKNLSSKGYRASGYKCDVACRQSVFDAAERVRADHGPASIVVANAGVLMLNYFRDIKEKEFKKTLDVNVAGPLWVC